MPSLPLPRASRTSTLISSARRNSMRHSDPNSVPNLESRLGVFLLKDPTLIERLPEDQGRQLDQLIQANHLEPMLYQLVEKEETHNEIRPERISSWKLSRLCATTRTAAYRAALDDIVAWCSDQGIPIRLLRGTQVTFYLCDDPSTRPVQQLELQTRVEDTQTLYRALKKGNYEEVENLTGISDGLGHYLPPLERDGVEVRICRSSCAPRPGLSIDPFPVEATAIEANPEVLKGEPLLALLALEIFERSFRCGLATLVDVYRVLTNLRVDWTVLLGIARRVAIERHLFCILTLAAEILGAPVEAQFLADLEREGKIPPQFEDRAIGLVRSLLLHFPVPLDQAQEALAFFGGAEETDNRLETQVLPTLFADDRIE